MNNQSNNKARRSLRLHTRSTLRHALLFSVLLGCSQIQMTTLAQAAPPAGTDHKPPEVFIPKALKAKLWRMGAQLKKVIDKHWEIETAPSTLRSIQWNAGLQEGVALKFVHLKEKVAIPAPYPGMLPYKQNTLLLNRSCSLHFYPIEGKYSAYKSELANMFPARLLHVTPWALVFLPNRFLHKEYPCPKLLNEFYKLNLRQNPKDIRNILKKRFRLKAKTASLYKHYLQINFDKPRRYFPWKRLYRHFRTKTIVKTITHSTTQTIEIRNFTKRKRWRKRKKRR